MMSRRRSYQASVDLVGAPPLREIAAAHGALLGENNTNAVFVRLAWCQDFQVRFVLKLII